MHRVPVIDLSPKDTAKKETAFFAFVELLFCEGSQAIKWISSRGGGGTEG